MWQVRSLFTPSEANPKGGLENTKREHQGEKSHPLGISLQTLRPSDLIISVDVLKAFYGKEIILKFWYNRTKLQFVYCWSSNPYTGIVRLKGFGLEILEHSLKNSHMESPNNKRKKSHSLYHNSYFLVEKLTKRKILVK